MPSFGETIIVSGAEVGTGEEGISGVGVNGINVGVGTIVEVAFAGGGVATLQQAVSKEMERRSGMIFFIGVYF
jgi:hypothetical protein